jgi:hypothetical protein
MADTNDPLPVVPGSITEAHNALLGLMEPEEETPETEESAPTEDVEESTEETQDEPLEEDVLEEEAEEESEEESEEEELDEDESEEEPDVYAVKVDGEELEVSLDELVKGYSRQSDYTRKTQELASQREQIYQAQAERQQYIEALGQVVQQSMVGLEQYANVDWESLREEDPIAFVTKKEEFRDAQERVRQAQAQQGAEAEKQKQEFAKIKQMALQEEHKKLIAAVPEWNEPEKRNELAKELSSYALSQGFKQEELKELIDHRSLIVLMKAQKYDALQKSDVKAKKLKNKPKVVRSGKGSTKKSDAKSKRIASMKRLKQTGRAEDAASLFEDYVEL